MRLVRDFRNIFLQLCPVFTKPDPLGANLVKALPVVLQRAQQSISVLFSAALPVEKRLLLLPETHFLRTDGIDVRTQMLNLLVLRLHGGLMSTILHGEILGRCNSQIPAL